MSVDGFQSGSKIITLSAPVRLTPRPPTRVVRRKINIEGVLLNLSMIDCRDPTEVPLEWIKVKICKWIKAIGMDKNKKDA